MKLFIKLMIFLVLFAFVGPYLIMGPDGQMKMNKVKDLFLDKLNFSMPSVSDLKPAPATEELGTMISWSDSDKFQGPSQLTKEQLAVLEIQEQDNIFYRWQDQDGIWQFSKLPNRNTLNLVVKTDPNANVLQGMSEEEVNVALGRVDPKSNSIVENNPMANGDELASELPLPLTVPVAEIPKLIDQAKDVQNILNDRVKNMDQMMSRDI